MRLLKTRTVFKSGWDFWAAKIRVLIFAAKAFSIKNEDQLQILIKG
jgi:hypothetical protein